MSDIDTDAIRRDVQIIGVMGVDWRETVVNLADEVDHLRGLLAEHGKHTETCASHSMVGPVRDGKGHVVGATSYPSCDCGWDDKRKELEL